MGEQRFLVGYPRIRFQVALESRGGLLVITILVVLSLGFLLQASFIRQLKDNHPKIYDDLGRPSLISANASVTWKTLKFIFMRAHRGLGDTELSFISDLLAVVSAVCFAVFFGILFNIFLGRQLVFVEIFVNPVSERAGGFPAV